MTGGWHLVVRVVQYSFIVEVDWEIVQTGTSLTVMQNGSPRGTGTIDPDTGTAAANDGATFRARRD
jgi:hypothetical protein